MSYLSNFNAFITRRGQVPAVLTAGLMVGILVYQVLSGAAVTWTTPVYMVLGFYVGGWLQWTFEGSPAPSSVKVYDNSYVRNN